MRSLWYLHIDGISTYRQQRDPTLLARNLDRELVLAYLCELSRLSGHQSDETAETWVHVIDRGVDPRKHGGLFQTHNEPKDQVGGTCAMICEESGRN